MLVGAPEDGSHPNGITAEEGHTQLLVIEDESKNSVELIDEVIDLAVLLVEMQDDLAVAARLQREVVLGLEVVVVVDLSVANDRKLAAA